MWGVYKKTLRDVFSIRYISIASIISLLFFILFLALSQITVVLEFFSTQAAFVDKVEIVGIILYNSLVEMSIMQSLYLALLSVLSGTQVSLLIFLIKRESQTRGSLSRSIGGMILGVVGVGCSACGSILIVSIFSLFIGTGNALLFLSQWGWLIGIVGIGILLYAIVYTLRIIHRPQVCL